MRYLESMIVDELPEHSLASGLLTVPEELHRNYQEGNYTVRNFILSIVATIISLFTLGVFNQFANINRPPPPVYPDVIFEITPYISKCQIILNILVGLAILAEVVLIILIARKKSLIIFRRILIIYSINTIFRGLLSFLTTFPDPYHKCEKDYNLKFSWSPMVFLKAIFNYHSCGSLLYSDSSTLLIIIAFVHTHYFNNWIGYIFWIVVFTGAALALLARLHYTVDVIIALYVVPIISWCYHVFAEKENLFHNMIAPFRWYFENMEWCDPYTLAYRTE